MKLKLDHCVITVSDWERSNRFYRDVLGAELVRLPNGWAYRFGDEQLNVHGPGQPGDPNARIPVSAGGSDFCLSGRGRSKKPSPNSASTASLLRPVPLSGRERKGAASVSIFAIRMVPCWSSFRIICVNLQRRFPDDKISDFLDHTDVRTDASKQRRPCNQSRNPDAPIIHLQTPRTGNEPRYFT